jgi:hypothetical protein
MASSIVLFFFITLGLELSDIKVYEPEIRALLGTASHFCEAVRFEALRLLYDSNQGSMTFYALLGTVTRVKKTENEEYHQFC